MNQQDVCLIVASLISVLSRSAAYGIIESIQEIPDLNADVPTIIRNHGYPVETHIAVTSDGYILQIFRIPYGKLNQTNHFEHSVKKQPVILQHGLLGDSSCFVVNTKSSLAFLLADEGYDVWLTNFRGTYYGQSHRKLSPHQYEFWNFSWDEMAKYDLTSIFELVFAITEQRFLYIGHSMGTTTFFAHMSTYPENIKYCKAMFALAPVGYMNHMQGALDLFVPLANDLEWVLRALGIGEFLPANPITHLIIKYGCSVSKALSFVCENIMFALLGFDEFGFDMSAIKMITAHLPSSSSARTIVQYAQEKLDGKFQHYDFGSDGNQVKYGTRQPPIYDVSRIQVPIAIYWGANDFLSQAKDVERLWAELPHKISKYDLPSKTWNHLDFLWAKNVKALLYDRLLDDLKPFC